MSITSYSELLTAVENWLARSDLSARVPEFITLAEAKLNRSLRCLQMETRATATIDTTGDEPEYISLPGDMQIMKRVRLSSVTGKPRLENTSGTQMDEYRTQIGNATGQPRFFTVFGTEMELCPTPDQDYTIEMVYRAYLPALTSTNASNWLLVLAPDAYLYGSLLEAAPYMLDSDQVQLWGGAFRAVIDDLNGLSMAQKFNAGPLIVANSGVTP